jgi:membrane peptidoglycan carboxypeptidase
MTDMLEDVVARATGAGVRARGVKGAVAGKTGTSRDGWFAGYTPNLVCVVWVGFDDNRQLGLTGADSALPIWAEFMKQAIAFRPDLGGDSFPRPSGIATARVCDESGLLAGDFCPASHDEIFVGGTQPMGPCGLHTAVSPDDMVPMFDEQGNFIGYGPPATTEEQPSDAPEPEGTPEIFTEPADGRIDDESGDDTSESPSDDGHGRPDERRRAGPPQPPPPGMIALPPSEAPAPPDDPQEDSEPRR